MKSKGVWSLCTKRYVSYKKCIGGVINLYNSTGHLMHSTCGQRSGHGGSRWWGPVQEGYYMNAADNFTLEFKTKPKSTAKGFVFKVWSTNMPTEMWQKPGYESKVCEPHFGIGEHFNLKTCFKKDQEPMYP